MRRFVLPVLALISLTIAAATAQQPQGPGQLRPRPGTGREPEFPAPKITDYKPKSTLVVPEHLVPRAKFPVVDIHGHPPALVSQQTIQTVLDAMDKLNIQVMVQANGASGDRLKQQLDGIAASGHTDRFAMFTSVNWSSIGPGFGPRAAQQLEADIKAGARGLDGEGEGHSRRSVHACPLGATATTVRSTMSRSFASPTPILTLEINATPTSPQVPTLPLPTLPLPTAPIPTLAVPTDPLPPVLEPILPVLTAVPDLPIPTVQLLDLP
jgi:hypothetical protein